MMVLTVVMVMMINWLLLSFIHSWKAMPPFIIYGDQL